MQIRKIVEGSDYSYVARPGKYQEKYPTNARRVRVIAKGVERQREDGWGHYGYGGTAERKDGVRVQFYTKREVEGAIEYQLDGEERVVRSRSLLTPWAEHQTQLELARLAHTARRQQAQRIKEAKQARVKVLTERLDALGVSYSAGYDGLDVRINEIDEIEKLIALVPEQEAAADAR